MYEAANANSLVSRGLYSKNMKARSCGQSRCKLKGRSFVSYILESTPCAELRGQQVQPLIITIQSRWFLQFTPRTLGSRWEVTRTEPYRDLRIQCGWLRVPLNRFMICRRVQKGNRLAAVFGICYLITLSVNEIIKRQTGRQWTIHWKAHARKRSWPILSYYPGICLDKQTKTTKKKHSEHVYELLKNLFFIYLMYLMTSEA